MKRTRRGPIATAFRFRLKKNEKYGLSGGGTHAPGAAPAVLGGPF